jgi:hypothetical protein
MVTTTHFGMIHAGMLDKEEYFSHIIVFFWQRENEECFRYCIFQQGEPLCRQAEMYSSAHLKL